MSYLDKIKYFYYKRTKGITFGTKTGHFPCLYRGLHQKNGKWLWSEQKQNFEFADLYYDLYTPGEQAAYMFNLDSSDNRMNKIL